MQFSIVFELAVHPIFGRATEWRELHARVESHPRTVALELHVDHA